MKKRGSARAWLWGSGGALVLGLAGLAWVCVRPAYLARRTLPDGSVLTVEAVTFGPQHLVHGSLWQRLLYAVLPEKWKDRAGVELIDGGPAGTLVFHVRHRAAASPRVLYATLFDEHECQVALKGWVWQETGLSRLEVQNFPRRARRLGLRLWEPHDDQWLQRAEIELANPAPGPYPAWVPPPLPARQQAGDLDVTLRALVATPENVLSPGVAPGYAQVRPDLAVTRNGRPAPWRVSGLALADATGNRVSQPCAPDEYPPGLEYVSPVRHERAVRLTVGLLRNPGEGFPAEDVWSSRSIPLPHPRQAVGAGSCLRVSPPREVDVQIDYQSDSLLGLQVGAGSLRTVDVHWTLLDARDERGRAMTSGTPLQGAIRCPLDPQSLAEGHMDRVSLKRLPGARRAFLKLGFQSCRKVTFLAPLVWE